MTYEDFIAKFKRQILATGYDHQLMLAMEVCKKLFIDYLDFSNKYQWGNVDILLDAISLLKKSAINHEIITLTLDELDSIVPDVDDFNGVELASYALNACVAAINALQFLLDKNAAHIYEIGICLTDTVNLKTQETKELTSEEIDQHPLMMEARDFLFSYSNNKPSKKNK